MRSEGAGTLGVMAYRSWIVAACLALFVVGAPACVRIECQLNSDCPEHAYCVETRCVSQCSADRDCLTGQTCNINGMCTGASTDGGLDVATDAMDATDARIDAHDTALPMDNVQPPIDTPMPVDTFVPPDNSPPADAPVTGTRGYLDSCASDSDCASAACTASAPRFCTRACSVTNDCADGQMCVANRCALDDTGVRGCNPSTAAPCQQYCYGNGAVAHCTRDCNSASDCPAGFACAPVGARHVCVNIEIPCNTANDCPSGLGFCGSGMVGCTSNCNSASDCPLRLPGLPAYTCESRSGQMVCVPPADVLGADPLGATCPATGTVFCRSGACDDATTPASCNQNCTARGGCGPGYGCYPEASGTDYYFVCHGAGRAWVNESCARSADCYTGLCDLGNYCSKLCNDGLCPTGMNCVDTGASAADGTRIRLCRR